MTIALIYGGEGYEHEVSMLGFQHLFPILKEIYEIIPVFIDTNGDWIIENTRVFPTYGGFAHSNGGLTRVDCAFPLLHGNFGEDGIIQSALTIAGIPFVGCTPQVGAICRNKAVVKSVAQSIGIPTLPFTLIKPNDRPPIPCFIKPTSLGSSIGAGAARDEKELQFALEKAFRYADSVMAEPLIESKRELECGFFSVKGKQLFTNVGEILSNGGFYGYDSKYGGGTRTATVAQVAPEINRRIKEYSAELVSALGLRHLARIDYFLTEEGLYLNEINTMPGFTKDSLYPRMLSASGIDLKSAFSALIGDCLC